MNDAAFREAYREHKDVTYRFARRMSGSAAIAEDIVQESFLALWRKSGYRPERGTLRAFLLGTARNLILQRLRGDRPHGELDEECALVQPSDVLSLERAEMVARAVAALPPLWLRRESSPGLTRVRLARQQPRDRPDPARTRADLLVTACNPYGGHLRTTHGYGIICAVPVPVLSICGRNVTR